MRKMRPLVAACAALAACLPPSWATAAGAPAAEHACEEHLQGEQVAALIDELTALVREHYVLEERIPAIERALRDHLREGRYDGLCDAGELAQRLTEDLRSASLDLHFGVLAHSSAPAAAAGPGPSGDPRAYWRARAFGLPHLEVLEGNVGYLEVSAFVDPALAATTVDAAFHYLAATDALVIDVRTSRGGDPRMVTYLASYLFDGEPFLLNRIHWRARGETLEFWTHDDLPGPRYTGRPVFVLTSPSTPSAAEGFSYHLKHFGRARIVGEITAGAAHPVKRLPLGERFDVYLPDGRAINPCTGTNWEGLGVVPDVHVPADDALETAHRLALE